jgi:hypothetical protein
MFRRRNRVWRRKQNAARQTGARYYGDPGTIHGTTHVDIELDQAGNVVSCWFRCQMLPFQSAIVSDQRAAEMRLAFRDVGQLTGVEVRDR